MYWSTGANAGRATHNSIGVPSAHKAWYLPAGTISPDNGGTETYTLVQNPNSSAVKVKITYLNRGGKNDAVFYDTIPANSRKTYNMADQVRERSFGVRLGDSRIYHFRQEDHRRALDLQQRQMGRHRFDRWLLGLVSKQVRTVAEHLL